jgi:pentatricopeptide repeat protein
LKAVIEALLSVKLDADVVPTLQRILFQHESMCSPEVMLAALDVIPDSLPDVAAGVRAVFLKAIAKASKAASAAPGNTEQLAAAFVESADNGYIMRISEAVQSKQLAKATQHLFAMRDAGFKIPAYCLVMFARLAMESEEGATVLKDLPSDVLSTESFASILEHASKGGDGDLLRLMYSRPDMNVALSSPTVCEALLRGYASLGDSRAMEVFQEVLQTGFHPAEPLVTALISLCAESRHVQMAEHVLKYVCQKHGHASLAIYSAMIKVYGHSRLYDKTCDLYEIMRKDGVKPDTVVFGSLIKAAVESGRLE